MKRKGGKHRRKGKHKQAPAEVEADPEPEPLYTFRALPDLSPRSCSFTSDGIAIGYRVELPWWHHAEAAQWFCKAEGENRWTEVPDPPKNLGATLVPIPDGSRDGVVVGWAPFSGREYWMGIRLDREAADDERS